MTNQSKVKEFRKHRLGADQVWAIFYIQTNKYLIIKLAVLLTYTFFGWLVDDTTAKIWVFAAENDQEIECQEIEIGIFHEIESFYEI